MVLAPLAIVAVWGCSYLLDCIHTLEAPGVPIEFSFETNSGQLTVRAQSYALAAGRGALYLRKPQLIDDKGSIVAQLDNLQATGLSLSRGSNQVIRIHGSNLIGRLTRFKNGRFDLQDYLPAHATAASIVPYDVEIDRTSIEFTDQDSSTPWVQTISIPNVKVVGVGQDWVASASANLAGIGSLETRIQNVQGGGLNIVGSTQSLELSDVFRHLLETPEGRKLRGIGDASCASLVVKGPFQIYLPKANEPVFEATVEASATSVKWQKITAESASFVGKVNLRGLEGSVVVNEGPSTATFRGSAVWTGKPRLAGEVVASSPNSASLPIWARSYIPKDVTFLAGGFRGWISAQSPNSYHLSGSCEATNAQVSGETLDQITAHVEAENEDIFVDVNHAKYGNGPVRGVFTVNLKNKTIAGAAFADKVDLDQIGQKLGIRKADASASVVAAVKGALTNPSIEFVARGQGVVTLFKDHAFSLGNFEVGGTFADKVLTLRRSFVNAPEGLLSAQGSLGDVGGLGISVTGRGVLFAAYDPSFSGSANLQAKVTGTPSHPHANGQIEAYDVTYGARTVPAVVADFQIDRDHVEISGLQAARGTASLTGSGQMRFHDGALNGSFNVHDVQIADWLGDNFVGAIDIPNLTLAGSIGHPVASAQIEGTSLVTKGIKLDTVSGLVNLDGSNLFVRNFAVKGAGGTLSASGSYDLDKKTGIATLQTPGLSLDQLLPEIDGSVAVRGNVSGKGTIRLAGNSISEGEAEGDLSGIILNEAKMGSGNWQITTDGQTYSGELELGDLDRYVRLNDVRFDPETRKVSGKLGVLHLQAEHIVSTGLHYFPDISFEAKDSLSSLAGFLSLDCSFDGTLEDPSASVANFQLSDVTYREQPIGEVLSSFDLSHHKWNIQNFTLSQGPAEISLQGTIDEYGETHIDATNDNRFDLAKIAKLDPRLSRLTGTGHLWVAVDGPTKSPKVEASIELDNLLGPPQLTVAEVDSDKYLHIESEHIVIDPAKQGVPAIAISAAYYYKGFHGSILGTAPFEYPLTVPETSPIEATVTFDPSDLKDIAPLLGGLDAKKTEGTIDGSFQIKGPLNDLNVAGSLNLNASTVAFVSVDNFFKDVKAKLGVEPGHLAINATSGFSGGGTFAVTGSVPFENLGKIQSEISQLGPASLLDRSLTGHASVVRAQVNQKLFVQSSVSGTVNAEIDLGGTLRHPALTGELSATSGDVVFNGLPPGGLQTEDRLIDPIFNLKLTLNNPVRLRSSTAEMFLSGGGDLHGSLQLPKLDADLNVERGTIRLPASLLRLDQGGTVKVGYGLLGPSAASATVDMEGRTSVTASRYGTGDVDVQRYDITLAVKGDLLQPNGLNLVASSDPPDLSSDRILAILGETDLLQSPNGSAFTSAFLSAVPSLLDPYTGQFAQTIGLDYLDLQYNAYDLASLAFGKILGSGFSIQGTRQLSEPPPGFPSRYDLRILYRPRRLPGAFNRFSLFFGADQDNPWKLGIDYGVRF